MFSKIITFVFKLYSKIKKIYQGIFSQYFFRERLLLFVLSVLIIIPIGMLVFRGFLRLTYEFPVKGGTYIEGITGQPMNINPLFSPSNLPDRALTYLIYSGLTKIDEKGDIVSDMAESWEVTDEGKQYIFNLRKDIKWQNGEQFLSSDVLYTISTVQDPDYIGPLKKQWADVNIKIPDEYTVVFTLPKAQPSFIYNTSLGILPRHIWEEFDVSDLPYVEQNLIPIGTGRFSFKEIVTDENGNMKSIALERNESFYGDKPFINSIVFKFYKNPEEAIEALTKKEVQGVSEITSGIYSRIKDWKRLRISSYNLPSYKAVFINNSKNSFLSSIEFRTALDLAVYKEKIVDDNLTGIAVAIDGIFVKEKTQNNFDPEKAKEILKSINLEDKDNDGFLEKDDQKVILKLTTADDDESKIVAKELQSYWQNIGIDLKIEEKNLAELERDVINPRNYELLFFGQNYSINEDLFSFWHSSQQKHPGLNFTNFSSKRADILLENAKNIDNRNRKKEINNKIEELAKGDKASIFLYSPIYNFVTDKKINGIKKHCLTYPEHRFMDIEKWYIKSTRVFK